ncbi:MAG: 3-isopropylmalate dehydratase large subunit [Proteobacteria bacterium]|nr:3-isopropylmalate dehydratase large subunit [Pseudomonadota bacterium]
MKPAGSPKTFVEKILGAPEGAIVFRTPDVVLTHDNTASIAETFEQMGGGKLFDPDRLLVVLDHNAPPTSAKLANDYRKIRSFVKAQGVSRFYDAGKGICHQLMAGHARPGMIIAGSDSHTCTAGAFNTLAVGIDRTEAAGLYKRGETWFRVPRSMKITLTGTLPPGVYAKDLALWIVGTIGVAGANYLGIEFHGEGVKTLSVSERMTLANMASAMGAKNAVFPADDILAQFLGKAMKPGVWADPGAEYAAELAVDLDGLFPVVATPHSVENIRAVAEIEGTRIDAAVIGTCTNGRLDDLRVAAGLLAGKTVAEGVQLLVIPASQEIYLQAIEEGLMTVLVRAGATILAQSCGPCLGMGQGIPADGHTVISTANRNFPGRMGNPRAAIYLASPATVAMSALRGSITDPRDGKHHEIYEAAIVPAAGCSIPKGENRRIGGVWNYADADNLNTDQMFAGNLVYNILSTEAAAIAPHLFKGFDESFAGAVQRGDIIIAGENFGCGSSREHPSVGLAHAGVKTVIVKSVNRIFYRAAINQGLPLIVQREAVEAYRPGDAVQTDFKAGAIRIGDREFAFAPLPEAMMGIIEKRGLVNWIKEL